MWVPWNMPDLSIPRPGSVPLTLETTSTPVTQSYVTLPSDGRPRHILNNSSSSSSEHPPLVPTGQRDDRQRDDRQRDDCQRDDRQRDDRQRDDCQSDDRHRDCSFMFG